MKDVELRARPSYSAEAWLADPEYLPLPEEL